MRNKTPFTDQQLYEMAVHEAYQIEVRRKGEQFTETTTGTHYTVIDIEHDNESGFDAIALKDEHNNIVVVYGGTNAKNGTQDIVTDARIAGTYIGISKRPKQFEQAKEFRDRVSANNPNQSITLTGHSLGGGMSNAVALTSGDASINFNPAPLPYDVSTVYGNGVNRKDIINYQTLYDPLRIAAAAYGGYYPGQLKVFQCESASTLEEHNMTKVKFDSEGFLIDVNGSRVSDFNNSNINTGDVNIDEAFRGLTMGINGALTFFASAGTFTAGIMLCFTPGASSVGAILVVAGAIGMIVGFVAFISGGIRTLRSIGKYFFEKGYELFSYLSKKCTKMIVYLLKGFLESAQFMLKKVCDLCGAIVDGAIAVIQKGGEIAQGIITVVYENTQVMARFLQNTGAFIQQTFVNQIQAFATCKEYLFEMTYSFLRDSIKTLLSINDIIALLGSSAMQLMADIVTLNWDKIHSHIIEKIDLFKTHAQNDFNNSSRGFNHHLAKEISDALTALGQNIFSFSKKIMTISDTFQEIESNFKMEMKQIGG